jgi:hypothetical protein
MGYSKIEINFTDVPFHDDILYITESKLGLNLNVLFRDNRSVAREVALPPFMEYDGRHSERYIGYISTNYKSAFDSDYNSSNLFYGNNN